MLMKIHTNENPENPPPSHHGRPLPSHNTYKYLPCVCVELDWVGRGFSGVTLVATLPRQLRYCGVAQRRSLRMCMMVLMSRLGRP